MSLSFEETVERPEWPLPPGAYETHRPSPRRRALRRLRAALARRSHVAVVVLAIGCTAALTAAVFVGLWTRESSRRKAAESQLADARLELAGNADRTRALRAERARLAASLAAAETRAGAAQKRLATLRAAVAELAHEARSVTVALRDAGLTKRGNDVSALAVRLGSVTATLSEYLDTTSAAAYDPGFVRAQLAYLGEAVEKLRASAGSLAAAAGGKEQLADRLRARAGSVEAALRKTRAAPAKR